jgi:hypothetical protein
MATCHFCRQQFGSAQAVRAHLKGCTAYLNRTPKHEPEAASLRDASVRQDSLGSPSLESALGAGDEPAYPGEFDPVRDIARRIAAERLRLQLRQIEEAHGEMDRAARARECERQREVEKQAESSHAAEREREAARQREVQARQAQEGRANTEQQRRNRRREVIQDIKNEVVERWPLRVFIGGDLFAQILQEIERVLSPLPVDELPHDELIQIAKGARDRLHGEATRAEQHAQQQAQQRSERKQQLHQHGVDYAKRELRDVEDLDGLARWRIELCVNRELGDITGDETTADIEDRVDDILDREGLEYGDDEE